MDSQVYELSNKNSSVVLDPKTPEWRHVLGHKQNKE